MNDFREIRERILNRFMYAILLMGIFICAGGVYAVPAGDIDWDWPNPEPDFKNEAYGPRIDVNPAEIGDNHLFDVWVPDGAGPFPVLIYAHGGGFGTYDKTVAINGQHNLINDDIVFISINYTLDQGSSVAINDMIDCVQYLIDNAANYKIDPRTIFLAGNSAGGIAWNYITFEDKRYNANHIKGVWHGNYHESQHSAAFMQVANLSAVGIPIGVGMNRVYPEDQGHSALKGQEIAERSYDAGNTGLFTGDSVNQVWWNGSWILYPQQGIDTGAWYPTQGDWINGIADGSLLTNTAPAWSSNPVVEADATMDQPYSETLADNASDSDGDPLTFTKLSGPAWLSVATNGVLSGTPGAVDLGPNAFSVTVSDGISSLAATLNITVFDPNGVTDTFPVIADTFTEQNNATNNFGADNILSVRQSGASTFSRVAYFKFNPTGLGTVTRATLHVCSETEVDPVNAHALADHTWTENGLTWSNAPVLGTLLDSSTSGSNVWMSFDVTSAVTADGAVSFALDEQGNSRHYLFAREKSGGANAAYLTVTHASGNLAPAFSSDPIDAAPVAPGGAYSGSLTPYVSDANGDPITYSKGAGPSWLGVASDGTLSGTAPLTEGTNSWTVYAADDQGATNSATLNIIVVESSGPAPGSNLSIVTGPVAKGDDPVTGHTVFSDISVLGGDVVVIATAPNKSAATRLLTHSWSGAEGVDGNTTTLNPGDNDARTCYLFYTEIINPGAYTLTVEAAAPNLTANSGLFVLRAGSGVIRVGDTALLNGSTSSPGLSYTMSPTNLLPGGAIAIESYASKVNAALTLNSEYVAVNNASGRHVLYSTNVTGSTWNKSHTAAATGNFTGTGAIFYEVAGSGGDTPDSLYQIWLSDHSYPADAPVEAYLIEYASGSAESLPATEAQGEYFIHVHTEWNAAEAVARGLSYELQATTNLVDSPTWSTNGIIWLGTATDTPTAGLETITNRVNTKKEEFIRLKIDFDSVP